MPLSSSVHQALRFVKWRLAMPVAARLGVPLERVTRLRLPGFLARHVPRRNLLTGKPFESRFETERLLAEHASVAASGGRQAADRWLRALGAERPDYAAEIRWAEYKLAAAANPVAALPLAEAVIAEFPQPHLLRGLLQDLNKLGNISRALELARQLTPHEGRTRTLAILEARQRLLERGFRLPDSGAEPAYTPQPGRVLYLLHNSLPHASGGYATRTHGLVTALRVQGWDVECATRLGYPHDVAVRPLSFAPAVEDVDGVPYYRLPDRNGSYRRVDAERYIQLNIDAVERLVRRRRPAIIHGASNHINGLTAAAVGKRLRIPSVYEVRGLWELTRLSRQPAYADSEHYRLAVRLETQACLAVDSVVTLTDALRRVLVERGVPEEKITVVPNGVDTSRFAPLARDSGLAAELQLPEGSTVFGFVGSMPQYEGLDDLIAAAAALKQRSQRPFRLLLIGDGDQLPVVRERVAAQGLAEAVIIVGRVPHDQVDRYYSVIDYIVLPRKPQPVCEAVSPLKPFEAFAMGIPVIASDVAALSEIVRDGETGLLFRKGSVAGLVEVLAAALDGAVDRETLARNARRWVCAERDWQVNMRALAGIYQQLGGGLER